MLKLKKEEMDLKGRDALRYWLVLLVLVCHQIAAFKVVTGPGPGSSCIRRTVTGNESLPSSSASGTMKVLTNHKLPSSSSPSSWISYDCQVRTLNVDFVNESLHVEREDLERTSSVRIQCNDKLLFESFLTSNQTLFRLVNVRQVEIESCKIRRLLPHLWVNLNSLKSLSIQSKNGHWSSSVSLEIDRGAFDSGLGRLEILDLRDNNIWTVPENIFCSLKSLLSLNMSRNRLTELDELNSYDEQRQNRSRISSVEEYCALKLQSVDLSFNALRQVSHISLRWKQVSELRLQNNLIEQIEDSAFTQLRQLKLVNLSSNRLVALPPSIFKFNGNLREIYLANNSMSALAPAVFARLDQLLLLDLTRNTLTSQWIREKMFHGLLRLVALRLSFNQLSYVDGSIFRDLISLEVLHLDNNRIETISPGAFLTMVKLRALDLSHNRLASMDSRLFTNLIALRQLYLDHNKIRQMQDDALKNCSSLQDLGLAGNLLQEVPVALRSGLSVLRSLDLGENRIFQVTNESFYGLGQLYGLRMVDNRLTELPSGFCDPLKKLRVLNFAQNRLHKISSTALISCPELRALRLDTNVLEELPIALTPQLPSLLWLNVSENRLRNVDYSRIPPTIEWLDLSHNSLETFGGSSSGHNSSPRGRPISSGLRVLDLSYNNLTQLDMSMVVGTLETIRVNYNKLKSVAQDTFIRSIRLRRVELVSNQLESLPLTALKLPGLGISRSPSGTTSTSSFSNMLSPAGRRPASAAVVTAPLPEFYIGGNPFICDCSMEWLMRVNQHSVTLGGQFPRIVDLDAISCIATTFLHANGNRNEKTNSKRIIPLGVAQPDNFLCSYKSHCGSNCHCCDFDACDCAMKCPDNCTCFHDLSWSRNIVDCSRNIEQGGGNESEIPLSHKNGDLPMKLPMNSTEIYLDGNHLPVLASHIFIGKRNLRVLYLNDSRIEVIQNKTFNGLKSLEILRLEKNLLTELHGYEFADLENLRELYLQNNLLGFIAPDTFSPLKFLQQLRLDGNLLVSFPIWEGLRSNGRLNRLMLSGNPWSCDCEFIIPFRTWVTSTSRSSSSAPSPPLTSAVFVTTDFAQAHCHSSSSQNNSLLSPTLNTLCPSVSDTNVNYNSDDNQIIRLATAHMNPHDIPLPPNNHISPLRGTPGKISVSNLLPSPLDGLRAASSPGRNGSGGLELLWTLVLTSVALLMLILVVLLIFRKEIYYRLNDRLNPFCYGGGWCCAEDLFFDNSRGCSCEVGNHGTGTSTTRSGTCVEAREHGGGGGGGSGSGGLGRITRNSKKCCRSQADDCEKLFDAYFLYSKRDEELLVQKIVPELEHREENFFRLCLHYRDLCLTPMNPWNSEMVHGACDASKRVVLVLSRTFLYSEWTNMDFRATIQSVISRHHKRFILILLPSLNEQSWTSFTSSMCPDLKGPALASLKNSLLEWTDVNFWSKFKLFLPPPTVRPSILTLQRRRHPPDLPYITSCNHSNFTPNLNFSMSFQQQQSHQIPDFKNIHEIMKYQQQQQQQQQQQHQQRNSLSPLTTIVGNKNSQLVPSSRNVCISSDTESVPAPAPPPPIPKHSNSTLPPCTPLVDGIPTGLPRPEPGVERFEGDLLPEQSAALTASIISHSKNPLCYPLPNAPICTRTTTHGHTPGPDSSDSSTSKSNVPPPPLPQRHGNKTTLENFHETQVTLTKTDETEFHHHHHPSHLSQRTHQQNQPQNLQSTHSPSTSHHMTSSIPDSNSFGLNVNSNLNSNSRILHEDESHHSSTEHFYTTLLEKTSPPPPPTTHQQQPHDSHGVNSSIGVVSSAEQAVSHSNGAQRNNVTGGTSDVSKSVDNSNVLHESPRHQTHQCHPNQQFLTNHASTPCTTTTSSQPTRNNKSTSKSKNQKNNLSYHNSPEARSNSHPENNTVDSGSGGNPHGMSGGSGSNSSSNSWSGSENAKQMNDSTINSSDQNHFIHNETLSSNKQPPLNGPGPGPMYFV